MVRNCHDSSMAKQMKSEADMFKELATKRRTLHAAKACTDKDSSGSKVWSSFNSSSCFHLDQRESQHVKDELDGVGKTYSNCALKNTITIE
mmetsp:Transcript_36844/g.110461  ORF Transcript_36844/g.110461 Transcript_36844/m.110461 type:complete len:91 (-) Transcript_36844:1127-1399(-)